MGPPNQITDRGRGDRKAAKNHTRSTKDPTLVGGEHPARRVQQGGGDKFVSREWYLLLQGCRKRLEKHAG